MQARARRQRRAFVAGKGTEMTDGVHQRLAGKTAFVSGGARGIGAGLCRALHAEGANVVIADLNEDLGRALALELGDRVLFVALDVVSADQWREAVAAGEAHFGPIAILCNNAGIADFGAIADVSEDRYRRVIDVNQVGVYLGMQAILPSMRRAGGGSIINTSSAAGMVGYAEMSAYVASKWAVRGMTKSAALEFCADNIRVNSIHPGIIATELTTGIPIPPHQPIPRAGRPEEVAALVVFLASNESSYCTGAEFLIDGGQLTGSALAAA